MIEKEQATMEVTNKGGLKVIKLINEPNAVDIAHGDIIKSNNERKVLTFNDWWRKF